MVCRKGARYATTVPGTQVETFPGVARGETLIFDDVLRYTFGVSRATGAFLITATGGEVTANLVVFTDAGLVTRCDTDCVRI